MPLIRLQGIGKTFGRDAEVRALGDVDLEVRQGEFVAIEGPSGSGKSTLLNIITALDRPSTGRMLLDETLVQDLTEAQRSRLRSDTFGFVFQSFHLMPRRTTVENVELGLLYRAVSRRERRALAEAAVDKVGLTHRRDTPVRKLSGGECQRVAIARAILGGSPVIVADEPTGNLDSVNSAMVMRHLAAVVEQGSTVIVVTHDSDVASVARMRIRVLDGHVRELDKPIEQASPRATVTPAVPGRASKVRCKDVVAEAARALTSRPGRLGMLVGAVALALGLVVATVGLSQSAASQVSDRFDVRRNRDVSLDVPLRFTPASAPTVELPGDYSRRLIALAGVRAVGLVEQRGRVQAHSTPDAGTAVDLFGVSSQALDALDTDVMWVSGHPSSLGPTEVLVGTGAAEEVGIGPLALDPAVTLNGRPFTVVGEIQRSRRLPALVNAVVTTAQAPGPLQAVESATLYLSTASGAAPQVARQAPLALDPYDPDRFETHAPPDPRTLRDQIQGDVRSTLMVLSILAGLASVLGVANAMMLGVLERVGELGLRRAIGARPVHVFAQTSVEALIVGAVGGLLGLLGGFAVVLGVTISRGWVPVLDLRLVPLALVGGLLVGAVGGSAASVRASRVQPADALRQ